MRISLPPVMKSLGKKLKKYLHNPIIVDIFVIGSGIKDKLDFRDIDIILLLREKDYKNIENLLYEIKEDLKIKYLHIEPIVVDDIFTEPIFLSLIHEGISVKYGAHVSDLMGYHPFFLFTFSLEGLKNIDKVRFAQTLYGRNGKGILEEEGGVSLGKGSFLAPVEKEHLFLEVMHTFKTKFEVKRVFVKD